MNADNPLVRRILCVTSNVVYFLFLQYSFRAVLNSWQLTIRLEIGLGK
ncbi:hypothetical protein COI_1019 [Mannheimia haemolytica serotype A2 str. OVINE]|nr:hypothetical protein COI_1019 [Mannheimia haemolytica serotype A2 str. OVINE]